MSLNKCFLVQLVSTSGSTANLSEVICITKLNIPIYNTQKTFHLIYKQVIYHSVIWTRDVIPRFDILPVLGSMLAAQDYRCLSPTTSVDGYF